MLAEERSHVCKRGKSVLIWIGGLGVVVSFFVWYAYTLLSKMTDWRDSCIISSKFLFFRLRLWCHSDCPTWLGHSLDEAALQWKSSWTEKIKAATHPYHLSMFFADIIIIQTTDCVCSSPFLGSLNAGGFCLQRRPTAEFEQVYIFFANTLEIGFVSSLSCLSFFFMIQSKHSNGTDDISLDHLNDSARLSAESLDRLLDNNDHDDDDNERLIPSFSNTTTLLKESRRKLLKSGSINLLWILTW